MTISKPPILHKQGIVLFLLFVAPVVYSCIVPLQENMERATWYLVLPMVLLAGFVFIVPFAYIFGPFGSLKFILWFWRKCISPRNAHLLTQTWAFSIFLMLLLIDLGIFCLVSPDFLDFMNKYGSWIGDAFRKCFGA